MYGSTSAFKHYRQELNTGGIKANSRYCRAVALSTNAGHRPTDRPKLATSSAFDGMPQRMGGTGEHAVCFAAAMPNFIWHPSDPDADARASTASWIKFTRLSNVRAPLAIDVCARAWGVEQMAPFDAIVSINMIHIAPWAASLGLFAGAGRMLRVGGLLILYGPFMRDGVHNAASNAAFDASLKARNPTWGLRDIADLEHVGESSGLRLGEAIEMPANNLSLVFERIDGR